MMILPALLAALAAAVLALTAAYALSRRETRMLTPAVRALLGGTYVTLSKGVTHYELAGPVSGRPVLLIHGLTLPLWTWDPHTGALQSAGLRTLRYDMYGRGYSDRPRVRYDRALLVDQVRELLDALGMHHPVDIVGSSLGSAIGVTFAARYPERVGRLVCICPLVNSGKLPVRMFRPPVIGEFLMRTVGMRFYTKRAVHSYRSHPERERYVARYMEQISFRGFEYSGLSEMRSDIGGDYREAYGTFGAAGHRSMIIYGSEDKEIARASVDEARRLLKNCEFHEIPGIGHGVELHLRPEVNDLLVSFLSRP